MDDLGWKLESWQALVDPEGYTRIVAVYVKEETDHG